MFKDDTRISVARAQAGPRAKKGVKSDASGPREEAETRAKEVTIIRRRSAQRKTVIFENFSACANVRAARSSRIEKKKGSGQGRCNGLF